MVTIQGIYKIVNKIDGKYYVGSSTNVKHRWGEHKRSLRRNCHSNNHLRNSWNKYGEENFEFILVEEHKKLTLLELLDIEQKYLDIAKQELEKCYNKWFVAKITNTKVFEHSEKSKEKIREKLKKYKKTKEHCQHISESIKSRLKIPENNPKYNHTIYTFQHKNREIFVGTRHQFQQKTKSSSGGISEFIKGKFQTYKGWSLFKNESIISQINQNLS